MTNNESEKETEESEIKESPLPRQKIEKKYQKALFWLLSIGNNTAQLLILNIVQYFAAWITGSKMVLGFVSAIRSFTGSVFQG